MTSFCSRGVGVGAQAAVGHVRELGRRGRRHLAHDGEHRALGRLAHRVVRALRRARHRRRDQHRVDELARAGDQLLGRAADQLAEDDAAVAARAEQRRASDGLDDLVAADLVDRAALAEARRSISSSTARSVSAMLSPVSPSATGKTLRSLISSRRDSRCASAPSTTARKRRRLGSADTPEAEQPTVGSDGLLDLAGLEAARADVDAAGRPVDDRATFCRFGSKRRLVARIEWLRLCPKAGPLPQLLQTLAMRRRSVAARWLGYALHNAPRDAGSYRAARSLPRRPPHRQRRAWPPSGRPRTSCSAARWPSRCSRRAMPPTRRRRRFQREARAAARVSDHPNVVTIYDVGEHDGEAFIVMELLSGGTVADRLRRRARAARRSDALAERPPQRARRRPRAGDRPPRRQARQPAARRRGRARRGGLRHRADRHRRPR